MAKDPVCGKQVDEGEDKFRSDYKGKTYFFCSEECEDTFQNEPERYADKAA